MQRNHTVRTGYGRWQFAEENGEFRFVRRFVEFNNVFSIVFADADNIAMRAERRFDGDVT